MIEIKEQDVTKVKFEKALNSAIARAARFGHPLDWQEIVTTAGTIFEGVIAVLKEQGKLRF